MYSNALSSRGLNDSKGSTLFTNNSHYPRAGIENNTRTNKESRNRPQQGNIAVEELPIHYFNYQGGLPLAIKISFHACGY